MAIDSDEEVAFSRRMVFVDNSNLIQSEARLRPCGSSELTEGTRKGLKKAKQQAADFPRLELDHSALCMDYHNQIVAGILASKHRQLSPHENCFHASDIQDLKLSARKPMISSTVW